MGVGEVGGDLGETVTTGPWGVLLSRMGTMPWVSARLAAISMQFPPLSLYEDLNQRGKSVDVTGCPFASG